MNATSITVHNTDNDASAANEVKYMNRNNYAVSFHFAVDDKEVVQAIPMDKNAWHCGNNQGNRSSIAVEICYSKSGGDKFDRAEENAAEFIASLLHRFDWGISRVKRHKDWSGKNCPKRTMAKGWDRFLKMIEKALDNISDNGSGNNNVIDVRYRAYSKTKRFSLSKWQDEVMNASSGTDGYAGIIGQPLLGLQANTVGDSDKVGKLMYRLRPLGSKDYWSWQTDREVDKYGETWAGNLKNRYDGIQMHLSGGGNHKVRYRVYCKGKGWLDWVTDYSDRADGYAGWKGHEIQAVQIEII